MSEPKKYYSEFSILDWAFTLLNIWYLSFFLKEYSMLKQNLLKYKTDVEYSLFTKLVITDWFQPVICILLLSLLIWALNPNSSTSTRKRRYLIITTFLIGFLVNKPFEAGFSKIQDELLGTHSTPKSSE